jgi:hypothetical protein
MKITCMIFLDFFQTLLFYVYDKSIYTGHIPAASNPSQSHCLAGHGLRVSETN